MIKFKSLTFHYPKTKIPILSDLNLEINPGTLTLVTGVSGSGKSTLLRCLNGLVPHFSGGIITGSISVFGLNPIKEGPEKMAADVGFVFQEPEAQFVYDNVEDEIAFALENAGIPYDGMHKRVGEIIEKLSIEEIRNKKIGQISGGEKQLVAIASALVGGKKLLILDEPTSQLDPQTADNLLTVITRMKEELGLTIIIAEHRLERLLPYTDNLLHLQSNSSPIFGRPREVLSKIDQVPPLIEIARKLQISSLPVKIEEFPQIQIEPQDSEDPHLSKEAGKSKKSILSLSRVSTIIDQNVIVKSVNFELRKGEILNILGPNGSGKTTLLRSILGLLPTTGQILLNGTDIKMLDFHNIIEHVAYLPQNPNDLLFAETVMDELRITLKNHKKKMDRPEMEIFLEHFGIKEKQDDYPRDISIGERQRVALAAIMIIKPNLVLLDEPTRGLDYNAKLALRNLIKDWANQGVSIMLVTHDVEFAATLANRVIILENGQVIFDGDPISAFSKFESYQTQTARLFPDRGWITPGDIRRK
jgi:energy-coupling factor transport system ATP-binding protein